MRNKDPKILEQRALKRKSTKQIVRAGEEWQKMVNELLPSIGELNAMASKIITAADIKEREHKAFKDTPDFYKLKTVYDKIIEKLKNEGYFDKL